MRFSWPEEGIEEVAPDFSSELGFQSVEIVLPERPCDDIVR